MLIARLPNLFNVPAIGLVCMCSTFMRIVESLKVVHGVGVGVCHEVLAWCTVP